VTGDVVSGASLDALAPPAPAEVVGERVDALRARIAAAGRDPRTIRIVAVTKGYRVDAVHAALAAGLTDIGENRAEELLAKAAVVAVPCWHYLGAIQRRRVGRLAPVVGMWQTVARAAEGAAIAAHAPGAAVLVQVDPTATPGHNGCALDEVPAVVAALRALALDVRGLMLLAPRAPGDRVRATMRSVAEAASALGLGEVSMGMTDDLDEALAEGTTMVRIGRGLFDWQVPRPV